MGSALSAHKSKHASAAALDAAVQLLRSETEALKAEAKKQLGLGDSTEVIMPLPELGELGVDGIGNYGGTLYAETVPELRGIQGYGRAGTLTWGKWEEIGRTNPYIAMGLDFLIAPIRDARVEVEPADDTAEEEKRAEYIRWALCDNLTPSWPDLLQQTARGFLLTGFSLHEYIWKPVRHEALPGGEALGIVEFAERLPSTVADNAWRENKAGELEFIRQQGPRGEEQKTVDLPVSKVWLNTWNRNGRNYAGFSAFRPVQYHCRIMEQLLKLLGIASVREGAGIPVAFSKTGAKLTKEQRRSLQKLLANLVYHENASCVMPSGWELMWWFSPAANKGHIRDSYDGLGLHSLMLMGAQQLALGVNGTGSRSVGEVHSTEAQAVRQGVVATIQANLNGVGNRAYTGPVRKLYDAAYGPPKSGNYPKLKITLAKPQLSPSQKAEAISKLKSAGLITVTHADENTVREWVELAPIDESEREAEKAKALETARAMTPPPGDGNDKPKPFQKAALRASATPFVPRRPLRASERVLDLQGIAELFDTAREKFADGARPLIAELLMRALPAVRSAMADRVIAGDEISRIKLDTTRLEAFVDKYLDGLRAEGYRHVQGEVRRAGFTAAAEEEDDKDRPQTSEPDAHDDAVQALVPLRKRLVRGVAQKLLLDVEREADNVLRTGGESEEVIARALERQVGGGSLRQEAGLVVTKAFSVGREEFMQEYADEIDYVELSSILDQATCVECERLDGTEMEFGSAEHLELTPPLSSRCYGGDNCRCLGIVHLKRGSA